MNIRIYPLSVTWRYLSVVLQLRHNVMTHKLYIHYKYCLIFKSSTWCLPHVYLASVWPAPKTHLNYHSCRWKCISSCASAWPDEHGWSSAVVATAVLATAASGCGGDANSWGWPTTNVSKSCSSSAWAPSTVFTSFILASRLSDGTVICFNSAANISPNRLSSSSSLLADTAPDWTAVFWVFWVK